MEKVNVAALQQLVDEGYLTCRPHPSADLVIWNYTPRCQFDRYWTSETLMCRGLITTSGGEIIARPFPKFFNYEEYQGAIPLEPFKVTEKLDGSLGILYFVDGKPAIATRGSFTSEQAIRATKILRERYSEYPFSSHYTYLFEIIFPENRIVIDYGKMEDLILLAMIYTKTGNENDIHNPIWNDWPFPTVKHYDGIEDIATLREREEANKEGFVIHFQSGLRLKMKFAEYVRLHRLLTQINAKVIWELLRNNQSFDDLLNRVPDEFYQWVQTTRDTLLTQFKAIEARSREVYTEVMDIPTRKEQAAIITKPPYSSYAAIVFKMLDNKDYADVIWKQIKPIAERPFREDIDG